MRLCRLLSHRPHVVSSCQLVVASPLVILSLCHLSLSCLPVGCCIVSCRPLVALPSCPLVLLSRRLVATSPLLVLLLLHRPLTLSLCRLVVASPLGTPPSRHLVVSLCRLLLSHCISWLLHHNLLTSSRCTALLSSHRAGWLLHCLSLHRSLILFS